MNRVDLLQQQLATLPNSAAWEREEKRYTPGAEWRNWVGVCGSCRPKAHHRPSTIEDVVHIVKQAAQEGQKVKVAGVGHSPSTIAYTNGHMIHLGANMNRILHVDAIKCLVTVEAGCSIGKLVSILAAHELMLPVLPSVSNLTIGGFLSVAGHSSGLSTPTLSAYIVAATFVTGQGEVLTADVATGENADLLPALSCSLGVLGVMCNVTLKVEPKATFKIHSGPLNLNKLHKTLAAKVTVIESYRFWWIPYTEQCYEFSVRKIGPADEGAGGSVKGGHSAVASTVASVAPTPKSAASITGPAKVSPAQVIRQQAKSLSKVTKILQTGVSDERTYMEWLEQERQWPRRLLNNLQCPRVGLAITQAALYSAAYAPALQPTVNKLYAKAYLSQTVDKFGSQSDAFDIPIVLPQQACEWAVPAATCLEILDGLRELIRRHGLKTIHFIVEVRFTDEDSIWLSPAYKRKSCYIGLVQFMPFGKDVPDTANYYRLFSEYVIKKGGRPHWSKYLGRWGSADSVRAYPKWNNFLALQKKLDPQGVFVNDWFRKLMQ